mmetsp:Transcript_5135/g.10449  ORF Transcript_5135/g.10449 Transcript_5135/m.10449 type:complete len:220 (-) Transcript_5135:1272-1931(-)
MGAPTLSSSSRIRFFGTFTDEIPLVSLPSVPSEELVVVGAFSKDSSFFSTAFVRLVSLSSTSLPSGLSLLTDSSVSFPIKDCVASFLFFFGRASLACLSKASTISGKSLLRTGRTLTNMSADLCGHWARGPCLQKFTALVMSISRLITSLGIVGCNPMKKVSQQLGGCSELSVNSFGNGWTVIYGVFSKLPMRCRSLDSTKPHHFFVESESLADISICT